MKIRTALLVCLVILGSCKMVGQVFPTDTIFITEHGVDISIVKHDGRFTAQNQFPIGDRLLFAGVNGVFESTEDGIELIEAPNGDLFPMLLKGLCWGYIF